jgi:quercetin dioxygenase-like cupin family protein
VDVVNLGRSSKFLKERPIRLKLLDRPRLVGELVCLEPGQQETRRSYDTSDALYVVVEGRGVLRVGLQPVDLEPLDTCLVPPGMEHFLGNPTSSRLMAMVIVSPNPLFDTGRERGRDRGPGAEDRARPVTAAGALPAPPRQGADLPAQPASADSEGPAARPAPRGGRGPVRGRFDRPPPRRPKGSVAGARPLEERGWRPPARGRPPGDAAGPRRPRPGRPAGGDDSGTARAPRRAGEAGREMERRFGDDRRSSRGGPARPAYGRPEPGGERRPPAARPGRPAGRGPGSRPPGVGGRPRSGPNPGRGGPPPPGRRGRPGRGQNGPRT